VFEQAGSAVAAKRPVVDVWLLLLIDRLQQ